ncbi:MAG: c-type cytochrome [Rhodocyclales bacterium]|nr:c-type cytochrome [Rhodocyclales bacterium]
MIDFRKSLLSLATLLIVAVSLSSAPATAGKHDAKGPESKPDALYHNYCSVCHGDRGDGRSRARNSLVPPPRDFTTAGELTREAMITIITHGKPGTAMVGWKTQLSTAEIESLTDYIRKTFMIVALDPKLQRGKSLYTQNCIACHGTQGQGSNLPIGGSVPARDLASPQARAELNRERMINSVTVGRPGTAMAGFGGRLPAADIEAVVDYVRAAIMVPQTDISGTNAHAGRAAPPGSKPVPAASAAGADMAQPMPNSLKGNSAAGERFYLANCATCHGAKGDGKGPRAYFINPKPRNFLDPAFTTGFNRPAIYAATAMGRQGSEMPAWSKVLSDQEIANVAEFVFQRFVQPRQKATKSK